MLDLTIDPPGKPYRTGGRASHVLCIGENDAYYNGSLDDGTNERNFRLRILRQKGESEVAFVSGSADGTSAPTGVSGSQSEGLIPTTPLEIWPGKNVTDDTDLFTVTSPEFPESTGGSISGSANLFRVLTLSATTSDPDFISKNSIQGTYTDVVASYTSENPLVKDPSKTYLNRTQTGTFVLARDIANPADVESKFDPN